MEGVIRNADLNAGLHAELGQRGTYHLDKIGLDQKMCTAEFIGRGQGNGVERT
ncbi:hypothetical protein D3C85_1043680 [compost metagenome]